MVDSSDSEFIRRLKDPDGWRLSSQSLLLAARILHNVAEESMRLLTSNCNGKAQPITQIEQLTPLVHQQAYLLYGLSCENLIKACIVKKSQGKEPTLNRSGQIVWPCGGDGHALVALFDCLGVVCQGLDRKTMEILTHWVRWQGRYPVPRRDRGCVTERWFLPQQAIEQLYSHLCGVLETL